MRELQTLHDTAADWAHDQGAVLRPAYEEIRRVFSQLCGCALLLQGSRSRRDELQGLVRLARDSLQEVADRFGPALEKERRGAYARLLGRTIDALRGLAAVVEASCRLSGDTDYDRDGLMAALHDCERLVKRLALPAIGAPYIDLGTACCAGGHAH